MDNKIYELMAQAEVLQEHALKLQNRASEAILEIPEAIYQVKKKLLSVALQSAFIWVILGALVFLAVWFLTELATDSLRDEKTALKWEIADLEGKVEKLRKEVQGEERKIAEFRAKHWDIDLREEDGKRWIRLGKGDQFGKIGNWTDDRAGIEIIQKK